MPDGGSVGPTGGAFAGPGQVEPMTHVAWTGGAFATKAGGALKGALGDAGGGSSGGCGAQADAFTGSCAIAQRVKLAPPEQKSHK